MPSTMHKAWTCFLRDISLARLQRRAWAGKIAAEASSRITERLGPRSDHSKSARTAGAGTSCMNLKNRSGRLVISRSSPEKR